MDGEVDNREPGTENVSMTSSILMEETSPLHATAFVHQSISPFSIQQLQGRHNNFISQCQ